MADGPYVASIHSYYVKSENYLTTAKGNGDLWAVQVRPRRPRKGRYC